MLVRYFQEGFIMEPVMYLYCIAKKYFQNLNMLEYKND